MSRNRTGTISLLIFLAFAAVNFIILPVSAQIPEALQKQAIQNVTTQSEKSDGNSFLNPMNLTILGGVAGIFLIFKRVKPTRLSP